MRAGRFSRGLITEATQLAGPVTANLSFSCTEIDSYVLARLSRIDTDGIRHLLSLGGIRPAARHEDTTRSTAVEIAIDSGREQLTPGNQLSYVSASRWVPSVYSQGRPCAWTWAAARTC